MVKTRYYLTEQDSPNIWEKKLDPAIAFGRVLRNVRQSAQLTQEELGHRAEVQRNFISLIERGVNQPTIRILFKLAAALQTSPAVLIQMTEDEVSK